MQKLMTPDGEEKSGWFYEDLIKEPEINPGDY